MRRFIRFFSTSPAPLRVLELNGGIPCKTYLIADTARGNAVLIDPLRQHIDRYLALAAYHRCQLDYIIDTHTHADHLSSAHDLRKILGTDVVMHNNAAAPFVSRHVKEGDALTCGRVTLNVLHTPGHTPDSISIYLPASNISPGYVFTGDTLLIGGTGRTDFAGGDPGASYDSITKKILTLPDSTIVFPAHDYRGRTQSTVAMEKLGNARISGKSREEYIKIMENLGLPLPEKIMEALQMNVGAIDDKTENIPKYSDLIGVKQVSVTDLKALLEKKKKHGEELIVLDVREEEEFKQGSIEGAINIPVKAIPVEHKKLVGDKEKMIVCVCRAGVRSATAAALLTGLQFPRVFNLKGGMLEWSRQSS